MGYHYVLLFALTGATKSTEGSAPKGRGHVITVVTATVVSREGAAIFRCRKITIERKQILLVDYTRLASSAVGLLDTSQNPILKEVNTLCVQSGRRGKPLM